ncbi:MAG: cytochrome P450 [Myxococcota bacterium]|nr:cytochrome P450 [Myxococcota bacterium]
MTYDPYSREMQENPYPAYAVYRNEEPCSHNPERDFFALFRFEDVWNATLDWQTYSSSLGPTLENRGEIPGAVMSIIGMDPPRHVRIRNLVSKGFTPRKIAALEGEIRRIARHYLDPLRDAQQCEFQEALSNKLPMDVISALLGIPEEDRDTYRLNVDRGLSRDPETGQPPPGAVEGMMENSRYVLELLDQRRAGPKQDLVSLLAHAEYEDVDGVTKKLSDAEAVAFVGLLAAAGSETTTKLLGNCMVYLARHPDQRKRLWDDPTLAPRAIEEVLRYDAPSQFQGRVALRSVSVHGVTIPEGARVALVTGSACRDEREFRDPDRFDIERRADRQIYFGHGQHVCIGKSLARLETRVVLEEVRDRFPSYEVDEAGLTRTYQAHVRGFATVPIRFAGP